MTQQQRRLYIRKTLNPLPYVSLPSDNGGIVLDVSEQGLRFRAFAPVDQTAPIHFSFSAHANLIEGVADLVWTDREKKTGGLRFTQLSDEAREQIRNWPHESDLQLSVGKDFMLQVPVLTHSTIFGLRGHGGLDAALQFAAARAKQLRSTLREFLHPAFEQGMADSSALQPMSRFKRWKQGFIAALAGTVAVILIFIVLSHARHRSAGEPLAGLSPRIAGEVQPETIRQTPVSNLPLRTPSVDDPPGEKSKLGSMQEHSTPRPANATMPIISNRTASEPHAPQVPAANLRIPTPATSRGKLVVQVAALTRETEARKMADSLRHQNFEAFVGTLPVDKLYRVMTGPYANEASARGAVAKLKQAGVDSFVRRESGVVSFGSPESKTP